MSDPFLGEIKIAAFSFAPVGWQLCQGQLLTVSQNQALFSLLGIHYGGNGTTTFGLPDLQGRTPLGWNMSSPMIGTKSGTETVQLTAANLPLHTHTLYAAKANATLAPAVQTPVFAQPILGTTPYNLYVPPTSQTPQVPMNPGTCTATGAGQAHNNMQPFQVVNFMIATTGTYPARN